MSNGSGVQPGESETDNKTTWTSPWPPEVWFSARVKPEPRFPVIIKQGTPLSTPRDLKNLVNMTEMPKMTTTTTTHLWYESEMDFEPETVDICDVNSDQRRHIHYNTTWHQRVIWFHGECRFAMMVESLEPNGHVETKKTKLAKKAEGAMHKTTQNN
ncbi:hypothetical protein F4777DRAFT_568509 [Nemania sp. FL0916]|nr:hypothetical protein F4777DRAFT_568509 [Nemania sp. FL0916]